MGIEVLVAAAVAAGQAALAGATVAGIALAAAGSLALSALTGGARKPKPQAFSSSVVRQLRTQQVKQAITPLEFVYGRIRKSGPLTFVEATNSNKDLHLVITVAGHACEHIETVWINDYALYPDMLDGDGLVETGKYDGKIRVQWDLGTTGAQPFSDLASETTGWTAAHRQEGRTKLYIRLTYDRNLFPTSIPNISVTLWGKNDVRDDRTAVDGFSQNAIDCIADYMTIPAVEGGFGAALAEIDSTAWQASANTCDEFVSVLDAAQTVTGVTAGAGSPLTGGSLALGGEILKPQLGDRVRLTTTGTLPSGLSAGTDYYVIPVHEASSEDSDLEISLAASYADALTRTAVAIADAGSGTHTVTKKAEPRYALGGIVSTEDTPADILNDMRSACAGKLIPVGGLWYLKAGSWTTPTIGYDVDDLRGPVRIQTRRPRRERYNRVKGTFVSPESFWQPDEYPPVTSATYEAEDNGEKIWRADLDLPFTTRHGTAQRLAKIDLEQHRRQISMQLPLKLSGLLVQADDAVELTLDRYGFDEKTFVVDAFGFSSADGEGGPVLVTDLSLQESDANVFAWTPGTDEAAFTASARSTLPDPFTVTAPTSLTAATDTVTTDTGAALGYIVFGWAEHPDGFVLEGGRFEAQFKKSADSEWSETWEVRGDRTSTRVGPLENGVNYDVRVRAVNNLGVESETWSALTGFTLGATSAGATIQEHWGSFKDPVTKAVHYGSFRDPVDKVVIWGEFV